MEREAFVEDVDDVFLGARPVRTLGSERVEEPVDGGQLVFDGRQFNSEVGVFLVEGIESAFQLLVFQGHQLLLAHQQVFDLHIFEGALTDGVDGWGHKRIAHLPKQWGGGYHYGDRQCDTEKMPLREPHCNHCFYDNGSSGRLLRFVFERNLMVGLIQVLLDVLILVGDLGPDIHALLEAEDAAV